MAELEGYRVPDFIIIGAMKCGTTSVHHILSQHPRVFIPRREVFFFDLDDTEQHPDFRVDRSSGRTHHDWDSDFNEYLRWYGRFFEPAAPGDTVGEDSTTYIASERAADRMRRLLPQVKLIAMLRDPVARAYSHYWHNTAMGRTTMGFERTVRENPGNYLRRGHYFEQLGRYRDFLAAGRLTVVLYEDFVANTQASIDGLCEFLDLGGSIDLETVDVHRNPARVPVVPAIRLAGNWVYRRLWHASSRSNIPFMPGYDPRAPVDPRPKETPVQRRAWNAAMRLLSRRRYPPMSADARAFLEQHFSGANAGLSDLIGRDVSERWPYMSGV